MGNSEPEVQFEWHYLGDGELIARIDEVGIRRVTGSPEGPAERSPLEIVTQQLGTDWTWESAEFGTLTDDDGTVTEWVTLIGARREVLTELPSDPTQEKQAA